LGPVVAALMYLSTSSRGIPLANDIRTEWHSVYRNPHHDFGIDK
jgi:hypothetical protein